MRQIGKKVISFILTLSILTAFAVPVWADNETDNELGEINPPSGYELDTSDTDGKTAFAIYDEADESLSFYYDTDVPEENAKYNDKTVTKIYTGFDNEIYDATTYQPWSDISETIKTVEVNKSFYDCQPISTAFWFYTLKTATFKGLNYINTSKVITMHAMFESCTGLTDLSDLSNWDTSSVEDMQSVFWGCTNLTDLNGLSNWNTSAVTNLSQSFQSCSNLTDISGLSDWDVSNVTTLIQTFFGCSGLTNLDDLSDWNTSNVTTFQSTFFNCSGLDNVDGISKWDVSKANSFLQLFDSCSSLTTIDISNWNTSNVTNMYAMFRDCTNLTTIYSNDNNFITSSVTDGGYMFYQCYNLVGNNGTSYDENKINVSMAHIDTEDNPGYFSCKDHSYIVSYDWDGVTSCTAVFTCPTCGVTEKRDCAITSEITKQATCGECGEAIYTATCVFEGTTYNGTKTDVIPATEEHVYEFNPDNPDNYKINLSEGWMQFILTCSVCGNTYTSDKIDLIFEEYDEYNGQSGITYCTAKITVGGKEYEFRKNINEVSAQAQQEMEAHTWVQKTASTATCTDAGIIAYDCSSCGATKEVVDPAKGHTWDTDNADWNWSNNYSACTLTAKCLACGEEETHDCDVVASTSGSTILHTATATMSDGQVLQDTKTTKASAQSNDSSSSNTGDDTNNDNNKNSGSNATITNTNSTASNTTSSDTASNGDNSTSTSENTTASSDGKDTGTTTSEGAKTGDSAISIAVLVIIALTAAATAVITRRHRTDDAV